MGGIPRTKIHRGQLPPLDPGWFGLCFVGTHFESVFWKTLTKPYHGHQFKLLQVFHLAEVCLIKNCNSNFRVWSSPFEELKWRNPSLQLLRRVRSNSMTGTATNLHPKRHVFWLQSVYISTCDSFSAQILLFQPLSISYMDKRACKSKNGKFVCMYGLLANPCSIYEFHAYLVCLFCFTLNLHEAEIASKQQYS